MTSKRSSARGAAASLSHVAQVAMVAGAAWAGSLAQQAYAGPGGGRVVQGDVTFEQRGNRTIIRASDGSIINYLNFNIGPNEVVRFIQPGEWARVLNRITGDDPSIIAGTLRANGQVYIVNPAGVYFHNGAVVDVAGLHAAAGSLSNAKFLAGQDKFTNLSGDVVNEGVLRGDGISLVGQHVANHGAIKSPNGVIVMAAGDEVYIREHGGKITVKVDGVALTNQDAPQHGSTTADMTATPGVENTGTINARRGNVALGAGDMYALAIRNSGLIKASKGDITLAATDGLVQNTAAGVISADAGSGHAGDVTVQGPSVLNAGRISADANSGIAGNVEVTSQHHTFLTSGSEISAAGGDGKARGGDVLVHAYDGLTVMASGASVDVSGGELGGAGGFAEVSGKMLTYNGTADLTASDTAKAGTLLLDPFHLVVNENGGDEAFLDGNIIEFNEPDAFTNVFVSAAALEALVGGITLQATGDISINHPINFQNGNDLTLEAYRDIFLFESISGANNFTAHADWDANGAGNIYAEAPIDVAGNLHFKAIGSFLNTDAINTGGAQIYDSAVDICRDMLLNAGSVEFNGAVNSVQAGQFALTINLPAASDGAASFNDTVGVTRALKGLDVFGDANLNGQVVITRNSQRYMGDVALGADASLISQDNGQIRFGGNVDGLHNLYAQTGGWTRFDAGVGQNQKLISVTTDTPGNTRLAGDVAARMVALGDNVHIANDLTVDADVLVEFARTVDGAGNDLILNSPRTYFRGDATGFGLLQTDADGATYFGGLPFGFGEVPVGVPSGITVSGNELDFNDNAVLLSDARFIGTQYVDFDKTVNGSFDLVAKSDHLVRFGGNVGNKDALESLTTHVGSPSLIDQNLVIFDGKVVNASGDITLNPAGRNTPAEVATVAARNSGGITFTSFSGDISMGPNEKLTSMGSLTLNAEHGTMTLGDLNAAGDMRLNSPEIRLRTRTGSRLLNSDGSFSNDGGVDLVAGGSITFTSAPVLLGGKNNPILGIGVGESANNFAANGLEVRTFNGLTIAMFTRGGTVLDLTPPADFVDLIDQESGPTRVNDRVIRDPIATQGLNDLAINNRNLGDDELLDTATGRYLQNDMFRKPPTGENDYTTAMNRLRRDSVNNALGHHSLIYYRESVDENTGEVKRDDQTAVVRAALTRAWKAYVERPMPAPAAAPVEGDQPPDAPPVEEPVDFRTFMVNNPEHHEALQYFDALKAMVRELQMMGLTGVELKRSLHHLLSPIYFSGISMEEFNQLLGVKVNWS